MAKHLFTKGNTYSVGKGRPVSQFDKRSLIQKHISEEDFGMLLDRVRRKALGEDVEIDLAAAKLIIDCVPVPKPATFIKQQALKAVKTEEHVDAAMEDTLTQVGEGELSVESGLDVAALIEKRGIMLLKKDLNALEAEKEQEDER